MASNFNQGHIGKRWCAAQGYYTQHFSRIPAACSISVAPQKEMRKDDRNKKPGRYLKFCCGDVV